VGGGDRIPPLFLVPPCSPHACLLLPPPRSPPTHSLAPSPAHQTNPSTPSSRPFPSPPVPFLLLTKPTPDALLPPFPFLPPAVPAPGRYLALLQEVVTRTGRLVAAWQCLGFVHGVLNTDNMSILGLTIDYGPYGFMDRWGWVGGWWGGVGGWGGGGGGPPPPGGGGWGGGGGGGVAGFGEEG
jgi:hypothetical protein